MCMPNPTIAIVTFWQGIVEIILRVAVIVTAFCALIASAVTESEAERFTGNLVTDTRAATGWLIFVTIVVIVVEGTLIGIRFLNFEFVTTTVFLIVDICISVGITLGLVAGSVPVAVYSGRWLNQSTAVRRPTAAAAAFGFIAIFIYIALALWMVLFIIFKWNKYSSSTGNSKAAATPA